VQATYAATLVDEWIALGLGDVVICPGSRSTPLALAFADRPELRLHVRIDERSAAFFALGVALATQRPTAVLVTSGTAAAELHAAVAEADQAFVPMLVITADRPPELHGVGAPQTMPQSHLFGEKVRTFVEPGVASSASSGTWRDLARALWRGATGEGAGPGPAHLNAAFIEPLVASPQALEPRGAVATATAAVPVLTPTADLAGRRVLCVVGRGVTSEFIAAATAANWVVVGDATAQGGLPHADVLVRVPRVVDELRPDVIVRLGGLPASKVLGQVLRAWGAPTIGFRGAGFLNDPDRLIGEFREGWPEVASAPGDGAYHQRWRAAAAIVEEVLEAAATFSEPDLARLVVRKSAQHRAALVVSSSMPVRDVEWFGPPREQPTFANRGVNGIDGVTSTMLGIASSRRAIGLLGDITTLHDTSGLVDGLGPHGGRLAMVVADNGGGGIFSFLAQGQLLEPAPFEQLFGTPRHHDLVAVAHAFGHRGVRVTTLDEAAAAIDEALAIEGVSVIVAALPDRTTNVCYHEALNARAAAALTEGSW